MLLIKFRKRSLVIIISSNYYICVKKIYIKTFLVLIKINKKDKKDKNKY